MGCQCQYCRGKVVNADGSNPCKKRVKTPPPAPPPRIVVNHKTQRQKPAGPENSTIKQSGMLKWTGIQLLLFVATVSCAVGIFTIGVLVGGNLN